MCSYLHNFSSAAIRYRTELPDFSDVVDTEYDWERTVYGKVHEVIPEDLPEAKGKPVIVSTWVDANLYHCYLTGRAVTGIVHLLNKTPIDWFTKKQSTVETATYGSEFTAARHAVDQLMDLRNTLRYLGATVQGKTYMFGDNKSVVTSASVPHSQLNKRHNFLAYHRVREAVAAKILCFAHVPGSFNPADILTKHWGHHDVWPVLQPLLFYQGDTADLIEEGDMEDVDDDATEDPL